MIDEYMEEILRSIDEFHKRIPAMIKNSKPARYKSEEKNGNTREKSGSNKDKNS